MKNLIFLILITIFSNSSFASLLDDLKNLNAKCEVLNAITCIVPKGVFQYPNDVIFVFNDEGQYKDLLIHLHGYSFGQLQNGEDFDSNPIKMVQSFAFDTAISLHKNLVLVIPFTKGKCNDYDQYLANADKFESFLISLLEKVNSGANLHFSAHSGGGRTLAKTINIMKSTIQSVSLFDANYNESLTPKYNQWLSLKNKTLNLIAVAPSKVSLDFNKYTGNTPFNETKSIFNSFKGDYLKKEMVPLINPRFYYHKKNNGDSTLNYWYEPTNSQNHHWHIVKDTFPAVLKSILNE